MRFLLIFLSVVGLDQLVKYAVKTSMVVNQSIPIIKPFLYLTYVRNQGAAFSLFSGMTNLFMISALIVIAGGIIYVLIARPPGNLTLAAGLITGGAAGNLIDRFLYHAVIDYVDLRVWPVFNLADSALVIGIALILVYTLFPGHREEGSLWKQ
jgi:signal peptidase II